MYLCKLRCDDASLLNSHDMKRLGRSFLLISALACCHAAMAQWVSPDAPQNATQQVTTQQQKEQKADDNVEKAYPYQAYLPEEVVPVVNGEVTWEQTFQTERTDEENYQLMLQYLKKIVAEEPQTELARVALVNPSEHVIVCNMNEWLTFKRTFLSLDRTRLIYTLMVSCHDKKVTAKAYRIHYVYDEQRETMKYKAEEWITNKYAVNKKGTKLLPISGKFRRKTVDRMNELMGNIHIALIN